MIRLDWRIVDVDSYGLPWPDFSHYRPGIFYLPQNVILKSGVRFHYFFLISVLDASFVNYPIAGVYDAPDVFFHLGVDINGLFKFKE